MNKTVRLFVSCYLICTLTLQVNAQQTSQQFIKPVNYLLYLPDAYKQDTAQKWPLLIFLHGSGESGSDIEKLKTHGPPKLIAQGKQFPFIVISPQAPHQESGWSTTDLYDLLRDCKQRYRVDPDRIYLTGLSMGGFGAWRLAMEHPEEFAAIVPICGGGDTADIWKLRNTAVWCFHGAKDNNVPLAQSQKMVGALRVYNPSAKLTVYPDAAHDSWTVTYNNDSLYEWLLAHKKFQYTLAASFNPALLQKYTGTYVGPGSDTVRVVTKENTLVGTHRKGSVTLLPASDTVFFVDKNMPIDVRFAVSPTGKVNGFTVYEHQKMAYVKIL